jgi:hypothetical protein
MSEIPQGCKPFNLQDALAGKPVVTRDGRKVKIAGYNPDAAESEVVVGWADGWARGWCENGSYIKDRKHAADLFMACETKDVWVVLVSTIADSFCTSSYVRDTEQDAKHLENTMIKSGYKTYGIHKITINI